MFPAVKLDCDCVCDSSTAGLTYCSESCVPGGWILQSLLALSQPLSRLAHGLGYCHMMAGEGGVISANRICRSSLYEWIAKLAFLTKYC